MRVRSGHSLIPRARITGQLRLQAMGGNLHFHDVLGCLGVVNNDDPIAPSGSLTLSSKQKISSP